MSERPPTRDEGPGTTAPAKPSISDVAAWLRRTAEERDEADVGSAAPDGEAPSPDPVPPAQRPSGTTSSAVRQVSQPGGGGASVAPDGSEPPRPDPDRIEPQVEALAGRAAEPPSPPRPPEHPRSDAEGPAAPPGPEARSEDGTLEEVGEHHLATGPSVPDERSTGPEGLDDAAAAAPAGPPTAEPEVVDAGPAAPAGRPTAEPEVVDAAAASPAGLPTAEPEVPDAAAPAAPAGPPTAEPEVIEAPPAAVAAATAPPAPQAEPVDEADPPGAAGPGSTVTAAAPDAEDREAVTARHLALDPGTPGTSPADPDDEVDELWPPDRSGQAARDDGSGSNKGPGEPPGRVKADPDDHATDVLATAAAPDTDRGSALRGIWGDIAVEPPEGGPPPGPPTPAPEPPTVPAPSTAPAPSTQVPEPPGAADSGLEPAESGLEPAEAPAAAAPASPGDQFDADLARMLERARAHALARPPTARSGDAGRVAIDDRHDHGEGRWDDRPDRSQVIVRAPQPVAVPVELEPVPEAAPRTEWDLDAEPTGEVIVVDPPVTETPAKPKVARRTSRPTRPTYPRGQLKERIGVLRRIRAMLGVVVVTVLLGVAAGAAIGAFLLFLAFAIRNAITSG